MRAPFAHLLILVALAAEAQPGWRGRSVSFSLFDKGVLVQPRDLQIDPAFHIILDGRQVTPHQVVDTYRSVVKFDAERSDPILHADTLWMTIVRGQERMRIAFPPPYHGEGALPYSTDNLHIDFAPGTYLAHELPLDVRVVGHMQNLSRWYPFSVQDGLYLRSGKRLSHSGELRGSSGKIAAEVACIPYFLGGRQWVDLSFEPMAFGYAVVPRRMNIRAPAQEQVDLKDFDFVNTAMVWTGDALRFDACVPRDTMVQGNASDTGLVLHPVNPTVRDTVTIELRWIGAGAPLVHAQRFVERADGVTEIRFRAALRSDVDENDMSGPETATPFVFTGLTEGRYVLVQEPGAFAHARDLDVLIGRELPFAVGERPIPDP